MGRKLGAKEGTNFGGLSRFCESIKLHHWLHKHEDACDSQILKKTMIRMVRNTQVQIAKIISFRKKTRQTSSCHDFWPPICILPKLKIYIMVLRLPSRGEVKWLDTRMENHQLWSSHPTPLQYPRQIWHTNTQNQTMTRILKFWFFSTKMQILVIGCNSFGKTHPRAHHFGWHLRWFCNQDYSKADRSFKIMETVVFLSFRKPSKLLNGGK